VLACPSVASAASPPSINDSLSCGSYGDQQICSGEVPSWDSTGLDVDLTKPIGPNNGRHPLIVMLHGFGGNKHNWESTSDEGDGHDKWHWNSHWFAKHGYYVLTYTARGHCRPPDSSCNAKGDEPATPAGTSADGPRASVHLKSREWEIRDTQWLAALVAKAYPDMDQSQVAVSGGSYGGGESWMQAAYPDWTFPSDRTGGDLPTLHVQVTVPKYPWTDLAYSLAPNGHGGGPSGDDIYESALGTPTAGDESAGTPKPNPVGTEKFSFVEGLFGTGLAQHVVFEEGQAPGETDQGECAYSTTQWHNRAGVNADPYDAALPPPRPTCSPVPPPATSAPGDEVARQLRRGLTTLRGSYYQDAAWQHQAATRHETAVFSIQGWTDDLFPAVESFRQFKYLKRLDPLWPVAVAVADVGHQRAQNKADTWHRLNDQAWQFLQSNIAGTHRQQTTVLSEPTVCPGDNAFTQAQQLTATTPEGLSNGQLLVDFSPGDTANPGGEFNLTGPATDPVLAGNQCTEVPAPQPPSNLVTYDRTSQPLNSSLIYVGLGYVGIDYTWTGADTATLNAKLFDRAPDGKELLVTRGTYRLFDQPGYDAHAGTLKLPLFGNHWQLEPGHSLHLQLAQVDQPFLRPSNLPSEIHLNSVRLHLPTRQAGDRTLPGG
jgi:hypothetical protein